MVLSRRPTSGCAKDSQIGAKKTKTFKNCRNNLTHYTKLKYHARQLEQCPRPDKIVSKYASRAEFWSESDMIRHAIHVIAWAALATPKCCGAHPHSWPCSGSYPSGLSCQTLCHAAELLDLFLGRIFYSAKPCRLKFGMRLMETRLQHPEILEHRDGIWLKLRKTLASQRPTSISDGKWHRNLARWDEDTFFEKESHISKIGSLPPVGANGSGVEDTLMLKRVRRLNHSIYKLQNRSLAGVQEFVASISQRLDEALRSAVVDTSELRRLLYHAAGALSPPRAKSQASEQPVLLDDLASERMRNAAIVQKNVRVILIRGITCWRDRLQLEDLQIEPILGHVRHLVEDFEKRCGDLQVACVGKQWHDLKAAVASIGHKVGCEASGKRKLGHDSSRKGRICHPSTAGGIYTPNEAIRSLSQVEHRPDHSTVLKCQACGHAIASSWFVIHPVSGEVRVLVPHNGHIACKTRPGHGTKYCTEDGSKSCLDTNIPKCYRLPIASARLDSSDCA